MDHASGEKPFTIAAPELTLLKCRGAIRGIGKKFSVNPLTGTGSLTVPIATTAGRSGFGPRLSLTYKPGSDNGPVRVRLVRQLSPCARDNVRSAAH
jgi:hypothetical protein